MFVAEPEGEPGFDPCRYYGSEPQYTMRRTIDGQDYYVPHKAILPGNTVRAAVPGDKISPDLKFLAEAGGEIPKTDLGTTDDNGRHLVELSLVAQGKVLAYDSIFFPGNGSQADTTIWMCVGELDVKSYNTKNLNLVLVPVNGATNIGGTGVDNILTDLQTELNTIYAPANVNWTVSKGNNLLVNAVLEGMEDSDDKILTRFTNDMDLVIDAFEAEADPADNTYYMFLINESGKTSKDGYMPFQQRYGFLTVGAGVAEEKFIHTTAHELGHGAFNLRHPFSDRARYPLPEGSTDNLMDYAGGTKMFNYQWDLADDPRLMLAWFMSEEEAAALDQLTPFEISSLSKDFLPDVNNLEIKYRLKDISKIDAIQEIRSIKNIEILILKDNEPGQGDIPYYYDENIINDTKNNTWDTEKREGIFIWNGHYNVEPDKKVSSADGEITLVITCTVDGKIVENIPGMYVIIDGQEAPFSTVHDGEFFLSNTVTFSVDAIGEDWYSASEGARKLTKNLASYRKFAQVINEQKNGIGDIFKNVENPLQYIYDNTENVDFIGSTVRVHWTFAKKLKAVETELGKSRVTEISNAVGAGKVGGINIRPQYSGTKVSIHSYGMAIDIDHKRNPYIHKIYQKELLFLIKRVTGQDLFDKTTRTAETITSANTKFLQETNGLTYDKLIEIYESIDTYNNNENAYKINILNTDNPFIDFKKIKDDEILGIYDFAKIIEIYNKLILLNKLLNDKVEEKVPLKLVSFTGAGRTQLQSLSTNISTLATMLNGLSGNFSEENIMAVISQLDISDLSVPDISAFITEYTSFFADMTIATSYKKLVPFATKIKEWDGNDFYNDLFADGFCNLPLDLINALNKQTDIHWGGTWNSSNVDYMHVEIKIAEVSKYLSQKKPE